MMRWVIGSSLQARRAVLVGAIVIMTFGVWQLRDAEVDALPEFSPPTVEVQTEALGLSPEEVEQLITVPLEQDLLDGVAWLDKIRSKSVPGLSSVELVFEPGTDLYRARQVVQERISQAAGLPNVSRPPQMLQPQSSTSRTLMVSLSSKQLNPIQIGVLARWTIRPRLLAVPGVSNVAIWGQRERQLQVQVDPQKLRDKNVTLEQVISSTGNSLWVSPLTFLEASTPGTGGFIDTPSQRLGIQHNLPIVKPEDLAEIAIDDANGATLGDVATVVEDHQPLIGDAIVNGGANGAGFLVVVDKLPYANTSDVTKGVEAALQELRPGLEGLEMDSSIFRPASYIDHSVDHLSRSVVIGAVLLLALFGALFFDWRTAVCGVVAVVLSFVVAALVLHLLDQTFNAVVFAGLAVAIGVVVHDAVFHVDNVAGRLWARERADAGARAPVGEVVLDASLQTARTVAWATVMFAVALVPIFFMDGLSGDSFFPPLAAACLLTTAASLVVAMTVTPALGALFISRAPAPGPSPVARAAQRGYDRIHTPFVRTPVPALIIIGVLIAGGAFAVPRLDKSLLPTLKDTNLLIKWDAPFGTSLPEMDRITARASDELRALRGVRNVGTQVGQAVLGDQAVGSDSAETWVNLDPSAEYDDTVAAVNAVVAGYPGLNHEVLTYSKDRIRQVLSQTSDEITVRLFGSDLAVLHDKATEVKEALGQVDGVTREHVASQAAEPTIEVTVDLDKARQFGVKPGDVRRAAATLLSGIRVGSLFEEQKIFDVQIWSTPETRTSLTSVQNLLIDTPSGNPVRLGEVAAVSVRPTVPVIRHEDISRYVDVAANVNGRDVERVVRRVEDRLRQVDFPLEYHAEVLGEYSKQHDAQVRLLGIAVAATIGLFLLLQAAFSSWRLANLAFLTLAATVGGAVLVAWLNRGPMTVATVAALLGVLAFALRQSITLIDRFQQLRADGVGFGPELVARGTRELVPPTMIATLITAVVLAPAIVFGEIAGQELIHPVAVVMIGGLVTSTVVTLFALPALYLRFGPRREPEQFLLEIDLNEDERRLAGAKAGERAGKVRATTTTTDS
jgi:Cu/Ag efflux pump CusA